MSRLISYNGKILADKSGHAFSYAPNSGSVNITTNGTHDVDGKVSAIVNIPTGTPRSSSDVTVNGGTVNIPAGLYNNAVSKSVASGVLGTVSADKSISGNIATITPRIGAGTAGYNTMAAKSGNAVTVSAAEVCNSGTKSITANGTGIDVTGYSKVDVNVQSGIKYQFTVTNISTGAALSGATIQIKHNGSVIGTVTTNSSGIAVFESIYTSIDYVASYSTWDPTEGSTAASEIGLFNTNVKLPSIPKPSSHTPGDIITWDDKSWLVCHYDSTNNQVYLITSYIVKTTVYTSLASEVAAYQTNNMSVAALAQCVDVTFMGATSKVFVPTKTQMEGGFSWFNSNDHRKASNHYWTSTIASSQYYWFVTKYGELNNTGYKTDSNGFRPCICVQL